MSRAPYRQQASALQGPTESKLSPDRSLCVFDVSGRPGRRAADGHAGGAGHRSGADGGPGGHAGPAEPGQGAGRLELRWAASGDGLLRVTGDGARPDGFEASIDQVVAFGDEGFVDVTACGGRGGEGGQGGRGGDGARGYSGSDATRYSSGSSGGPGGDGGPGGRGSRGARGGDGGQIRVRVGDEDTHLLMLLREHVGGGGGGVPGRNGSGGSGGAGGAGGSSYSWTESESYTDSQGQSQSRTTWHSNPGGSSGSSGRDGPAGGARLEGGAAGRAGAFSIEVEGAAGTARYGSRYHLELASFRHESENQDGICEPQEKVRVFDIEIDNVGGMPTPRTRDVELYLARRGWVRPLPQKLVLQHDIAAGERCKVGAGALEFEIGDYVPQGPGDALACEERIGFVAQVPAVRRSFGLFDGAASERCGRFLIRFPVEATGVEGLPSLAPGQAARVRFAVRNVSSRAFGSASELGRAVRVRLFVKHSEVARGEVTIEELDRTACDSEGFVRDLERLEAGEVRRFEAVVSVGAGAEHYRAVRFWLELSLGTISEPATLRTVQIGALDLRVAQRYAPRPGSHVLLCVNHATSRELLDAWRAAAGRLGLELNVWDASLEGGIDFQRRLPDGGSLLDAYAGQSVVVLNNAIQTPDGPSYPHRQVALGDLVALVRTGARVLFVGKKPPLGDIATAATEAPAADAPGAALALRPASDTRALVASLAALASDGSHPAPIVVEERIRRSRWYVPRERDLRARALELTRAAMAALPGQRWLVVERFDPELVERGVLRHRFRLGTLEIRPGLATVGAVIHSAATDDALADPDAVGGPSSLVDLLLTRSFGASAAAARGRLAARRAAPGAAGAAGRAVARRVVAGRAPGGHALPAGVRRARLRRVGRPGRRCAPGEGSAPRPRQALVLRTRAARLVGAAAAVSLLAAHAGRRVGDRRRGGRRARARLRRRR